MPLRRGRKRPGRDPGRLHRQPQNRHEALRGLGYLRLLRFIARQASLAAAGRRRRSKTQGGAGDAGGVAYGRARSGFGERNGCPASGVLPRVAYVPATPDALREHYSMACESDHPCRGGADSGGRESVLRKPLNTLLVLGSAAALVMVGSPLAA